MHWKARRDFLSRVEIFKDLSRRDLKALAKSCSEAAYPKGAALCRQGERGVTAFLITSGTVDIETKTQKGTTAIVASLGQGTMVGELSVIDGAERVATVRAQGEVETLVLTQWSMMALLRSRPTIAAAMLPVIVKRFRETARELGQRDTDGSQTKRLTYQ
jgi:CRP/FNR family cyclic AMP-dependent transcriptional regulator